jgi:hypothetical protein
MPKTFILPPQNKAPQSIIRVNPTWTITKPSANPTKETPVPAWYVSLRAHEPPLENLVDPLGGNRVVIYTSSAMQVCIL